MLSAVGGVPAAVAGVSCSASPVFLRLPLLFSQTNHCSLPFATLRALSTLTHHRHQHRHRAAVHLHVLQSPSRAALTRSINAVFPLGIAWRALSSVSEPPKSKEPPAPISSPPKKAPHVDPEREDELDRGYRFASFIRLNPSVMTAVFVVAAGILLLIDVFTRSGDSQQPVYDRITLTNMWEATKKYFSGERRESRTPVEPTQPLQLEDLTPKPPPHPVIVQTWNWPQAVEKAYHTLVTAETDRSLYSHLDAVVEGCAQAEVDRCGGSVGPGGSPDERGESTQDALVMDGTSMRSGAVGGLRRIAPAIRVARAVLDNSTHSLLVGDGATDFAKSLGFKEQSLASPDAELLYKKWKDDGCKKNFRKNITGNFCGQKNPVLKSTFDPKKRAEQQVRDLSSSQSNESSRPSFDAYHHDTISMLSLNSSGDMAVGTSSNGARHKIPGRVGDGAVVGSGAYAISGIGACGATGDGDVMMTFAPCVQALHCLRDTRKRRIDSRRSLENNPGLKATLTRNIAADPGNPDYAIFRHSSHDPSMCADNVIQQIRLFYPYFQGALVILDRNGNHGAASTGFDFEYLVKNSPQEKAQLIQVKSKTGKGFEGLGEKKVEDKPSLKPPPNFLN